MSDITALGQQIAQIISACKSSADYLNQIDTGLRHTTEAAQQLLQSTSQHNYQPIIHNLCVAQIRLTTATADLLYAADTASKWLETHVGDISNSSLSGRSEPNGFSESAESSTEPPPDKALAEYEAAHHYEDKKFPPSYCNDPAWRVLYKAAYPNAELPRIAPATAWALLQQYMSSHNYGKNDADTYMQDPVWQELNKYAFPNPFSRPDPKNSSQKYSEIIHSLNQKQIQYHKIVPYKCERTDAEIIARLGGGDKTDGSCSSLAFAYAGNKAGYDVLDFRGGDSLAFYSSDDNIKMIAELPKVDSWIVNGKNEFQSTNELLQKMVPGKEYYLATGRHAAIVKKQGDQFYYLELQSAIDNGWHLLDNTSLRDRFRCQRNFFTDCSSFLIDLESLSGNTEFLDLLGYLNTMEPDQKKGVSGHER